MLSPLPLQLLFYFYSTCRPPSMSEAITSQLQRLAIVQASDYPKLDWHSPLVGQIDLSNLTPMQLLRRLSIAESCSDRDPTSNDPHPLGLPRIYETIPRNISELLFFP